jgi:hypothetical protein
MSDATEQIGFTRERFILEMADQVGLTEYDSAGSPTIPVAPANIAKLGSALDRGYKSFLSWNPRWTFLERDIDIDLTGEGDASPLCVNGERWRYRLPEYISGPPKSDWEFNTDNVLLRAIKNIPANSLKKLHFRRPYVTGIPLYASVRPLVPDGGTAQRNVGFELVVWPTPSQNFSITAVFRITPPNMVALDDRAIGGPEHDLAVLEQAIYEFKKADNPGMERPMERLIESKRFDDSTRSRDTGPMSMAWYRDPAVTIEGIPGTFR